MEVMRNMTIDTELFELGDIISFTLTTGEKVKAKAIRETPNGMLFITVDCLKDEQKMFENPGRAEKVDYEHSDLRKKLNGEIFESFPEEIKGRMVGMRVGQTNCFDMLRIPTEREIFGENPYGKDEPVSVRRFYGMENRRERIAFQGSETGTWEWYWLQNKVEDSASYFAGVSGKVAPVGMICRGDRQKDAEAASPTLAGLKGKRFVTMSESNEYGKLDEEKIKQLTGGEEISARALYQSAITFKPQFTLWLSCNDLPMVTDKSLFASERIKVVEFNRHFSPEEQDTHLKDELCEQSSMSGIFMWLVRGYIHYKERGLAMSGSLKSVVTKYERDNDLVLQFLENRCERVPEESSPTVIKAKDLYNAFKIWAKSEGAYILSARKFNSEMERHPEWFDRKSTSSGYATYCGLKLKEVL